jgi:hypothetical protein
MKALALCLCLYSTRRVELRCIHGQLVAALVTLLIKLCKAFRAGCRRACSTSTFSVPSLLAFPLAFWSPFVFLPSTLNFFLLYKVSNLLGWTLGGSALPGCLDFFFAMALAICSHSFSISYRMQLGNSVHQVSAEQPALRKLTLMSLTGRVLAALLSFSVREEP